MTKAFLYLLLFLSLSIGVGTVILAHHYINWGSVADPSDILHHEFFASIAFSFGAGILFTIFMFRGRGRYG